MTFTDSISTCFRKYFTISGRASRSEFWWFELFTLLGSIVFTVIDNFIFEIDYGDTGILGSLFSLTILIPTITVTTRRLHDINRSGFWQIWWALIALGLAALFAFIGVLSGDLGAISTVLIIVSVVIVPLVWALLWLIKASDIGENNFGTPPYLPKVSA